MIFIWVSMRNVQALLSINGGNDVLRILLPALCWLAILFKPEKGHLACIK